MFETFFPDEWVASSYEISYKDLYNKGYRGLIFDIDNTLVPHGAPATKKSIQLIKGLMQLGFSVCFMSNNQEKRVASFNEEIGAYYIYDAHKPSRKSYLQAMKKMGTNKDTTIFIGDQLFTDIWGAKRIGIRNILVKPIHKKEEIQIVLKRILEKIVLSFYKRKCKKEGILYAK